MAMVHLAMHDAANVVDLRYRPFAVATTAPHGASVEAAVVAAAHAVLYTGPASGRSAFDAALEEWLSSIPDGPAKDDGIITGKYVAAVIVRAYTAPPVTLPLPDASGPGTWRAPPGTTSYPAPFLEPAFTYSDPAAFRAGPPPDLASAEYARDFNESKGIGAANSTTRTAEQTAIADFWSPVPPLGPQWFQATQQAATAHHLDLWDSARLFAGVALVLSDSIQATLEAKYAYLRWRPQQGVREMSRAINPATAGDPNWAARDPALGNPDYPSGHATQCTAAAEALIRLLGTDDLNFSIAIPEGARSYATFSGAARECTVSRIYGGSHSRTASETGATIGRNVAEYVVSNYLLPAR